MRARSGGAAKVYRTTDAGRSWQDVSPPDTVGLNFRDVEATDARTATVLAIGEGEASRMYRTTDGGAHVGRDLPQRRAGGVRPAWTSTPAAGTASR